MSVYEPDTRHNQGVITGVVSTVLAITLAVALGFLVVSAQEEQTRRQNATRDRVASHWSAAGVRDATTTLKDNGQKRTTGAIGSCAITIEGFEQSVVVSLVIDPGNSDSTIQATTFDVSAKPSPDMAAFDFVKQLPATMEHYCGRT